MGMNRLLTVKEVAVLLQTSRVQVRRMIQSGELAALKVGREYRIPFEALQEFVQQRSVNNTKEAGPKVSLFSCCSSIMQRYGIITFRRDMRRFYSKSSDMYHQPCRFDRSSIPKQKDSHHVNVVCDGSPSAVCSVCPPHAVMPRHRPSARNIANPFFILRNSFAFSCIGKEYALEQRDRKIEQ